MGKLYKQVKSIIAISTLSSTQYCQNAISPSKIMEPFDMLSQCLLSKPQYFNRGHGQRECFNHKNRRKSDLTHTFQETMDVLHLRMERSM